MNSNTKMSKVHAIEQQSPVPHLDFGLQQLEKNDYAHLPEDPQRVLLSAPRIQMMRCSVIKERPKDIILHTMKLTYRGWVWYITVRRTPLRNLYSAMAKHENPGSLRKEYFEALLADTSLRNKPELLEALELSRVSFDPSLGPSFKEGFIKARCSADTSDRLFKTEADRAVCGNYCGEGGGINCCCCVCFCFRKKATIKRRKRFWAVLKNSSLSFYDSQSCEKVVDVISFQPSTVVSDALVSTGSRHGLVIIDTCWMAEMKCDSQIHQKQWVAMIKSAIVQCPWVEKERFKYEPRNSGSLLTHGSMSSFAQWFISPKDLWENIHDSLLAAKDQVLIAGWWISPEIFLKRPHSKFPESRLDRVIGKIAAAGVKVYILQFREPKVMPLKSEWTRECFLSLNNGHKNIQYLRHGDVTFPYMFSHHEKLVIIDQDLAYVGGVDLSLGRWDTNEYKLRDDGPRDEQLWVGKDYQNPRIKDYIEVNKAMEDNPGPGTNRSTIPRMPRRDIHMRVFGQTALDVAWHFIQRWNYTRYVSKSKTQGVDPLCIYGAGAAEMMSSDHVQQQSEFLREESKDSNIQRGGSAGHFTNLIGKQSSRSKLDLDNTISEDNNDNDSDSGRLSVSAMSLGGRGGKNEELSTSVYNESSKSNTGRLTLSGRLGGGGSNSNKTAGGGRRPSIIQSMKRRLSIAPPTPQLGDSALSQSAGPSIQKPESVDDEEWGGMSRKQRRSSIMGSTIEVDGKEVKVQDLQNPDNRSVMPFSHEEDHNNQRSRMINNLSSQMASSGTSQINVMGNVTERDAAFLPTLNAPVAPPTTRTRGSFLQKISSTQQRIDERRSSGKVLVRGIREEDEDENDEDDDDDESSFGTADTGEEKKGEGKEENDFGKTLGKQFAPLSDCTGNPLPVRCHLLRSLGRWSGGLLETEKGIQNAYKHFIETAQHYIYIENQFFVSGMRGNGRVTNTLAQCLYARIMKAAMSKSKFKVLILIPLLPAMEGPMKGGALSSIAGVMYWQYRSICSGGNSLLESLEKAGVDWKKYIKFIGLRNHEKMSTGWQTEMVYIHSKLMIVDDRATIIGSANFNDRSMVGNKDSEICILTEDTQFDDGKMGNASYRAGKFSKSLRMKCWAEFCGIDMKDTEGLKKIEDPSCDETWEYLRSLAVSNTVKYEQVFRDLVPSNRIRKGEDLHGTGTSSGEVKDADFKRRMSMSSAEVSPEDLLRLQETFNGAGAGGIGANFNALQALNVARDTLNVKSHAQQTKKKAINMLESVQGFLVDWPLEFMKEEFSTLHPTALPGEIFK
ncbi:hypothetical protein TrRE_jg10713 [Triparma retinervis]|uniref:Phospholipase n=1 Tax=Triparma retinervis TaxID=2557542 RepID=A0A9W7DUM0_9STRA|nr:hypothetical protein TrRE_jg10713 [Triparma retinervis]